jgi:hypothetical protein
MLSTATPDFTHNSGGVLDYRRSSDLGSQICLTTGTGLLRLLGVVTQMDASMIHKAKDLSPGQKAAIESLLGRVIAEDEEISIRSITLPSPPDWLKESWESAIRQGVDQLSMEEIDAEIAATRKARRERQSQ